MTQVFDFEKFLAEMAKLDHADILTQAEAECGAAERASSGSEVELYQRQLGNRYAHHVREFLFFMRYGARPPSASDRVFLSYRPVVEALVEKGQLKPEVLSLF